MCGICGIVRFDQQRAQESSIGLMMQSMKHRGPDDEGSYFDANVGLGFVRLSIIDLSAAGHQPMKSGDGRYVVVFNGEIYNYIELRSELQSLGVSFRTQTDTEVLLQSYIYWGEKCLDKFNGMWAFVIYDSITKSIFGARDRFGIKPFYYSINENRIIFASEINSILAIEPSLNEINNQAVFDYLAFNRTDQTTATFYANIHRLQHGSFFRVTDNSFVISKWYDLRKSISKPFLCAEEYLETFLDSIKLRLRSDVPIGVCLSGGIDSSSIVSVLAERFGMLGTNTFSAVYGKGQFGDESHFIDLYRPQLKNMYSTVPTAQSLFQDHEDFIKTIGEPTPSTAPYAQYKVMELAKEHVTVTLDGQGADEQLAGYHYFYGFYFKQLLASAKLGTLAREAISYTQQHNSLYGLKTLAYYLLPANLRASTRVGQHNYINPEFRAQYIDSNQISDQLYGASSLQDAMIRHFEYKLEHLLKWEDRNSMRFSIEARVPFLDYRLVERTLATHSSLIIKSGITKHIHRQAMKGILPEAIRNRRDKVGFDTPQDEWFRTPIWQKEILSVLSEATLRDFLQLDKCKVLYQRHLDRKISISKEIWKWVNLAKWGG